MKLVFVTGTDTDVGKTHVAAALTRAWDANYWKPIQTGTTSDPGDTTAIQTFTRLPNARFCRPQVELEYPLSPWRASLKEGLVPVKVSDIEIPDAFNISPRPLVIEGAGGLMVPINEKEIMTDLIIKFKSPVILVARSGLGTLNHTLLSIEHLRYKGVRDIYVVFNGPLNKDNQEAVETFAPDIKILACIPPCENGIEGLVKYIPSIEFLRV